MIRVTRKRGISVLVKQRLQTNLLMAMVVATAVSVFFGTQVFAQSVTNSANVLKVSPVRSDIEVKAGETKKVQTTVTNLTKTPITIKAITNDFIAGDERGTPALILDADKYAPTHSLKRFMKPIADVTIPAGKAKAIEVTIAVPKDAQAGGYFGAVRFAPTTPGDGGQVNLSGSVASLMLLTVPGPAIEKMNLTEFVIQQGGKSAPYFQSANDLQASVRFENKGNLQMGPFGKLSIKEGDKVVYDVNFNDKNPRDVILPDSARRWDIPLKNIGSFGHYTVSATFTYGSKNQTVEVTESFWIIPQMVIIGTIVGILLLIALIVGIWLFLRHYKRRVLRHHGGRSSGLGSLRR